ncbi:MAG: hypothetical protein J6C96_09585 [Oscillospiraceae bacterium]|nr:hypothetical protein [Oscillospiraceae bacterium]
MDICFHIPDFGAHFRLNTILLRFLRQKPEYFYDNIKIASVFGTFPGSVWNGGRFLSGTAEYRSIQGIIKTFNDVGIPLRFTFTNPMLKKEHLGDHYCNWIMREANNGLNEVIVMSPILEEYIRENYPKYPITSSTCKQIEDMDGVNAELKKDYKYVVLDYNWNNKFDMLEKIDPAERGKCEILVNACCVPHCPQRGAHYRKIGEDQIKFWEFEKNPLNKNKPFEHNFECPYSSYKKHMYDTLDFETRVTPEDIINKYIPMGFNQFKIEGRTDADINLLENYIYYMAKPEYKDRARLEMLASLTQGQRYFMK